MNILVLNCGSSSVKYQLIEMKDETRLTKGVVEKIGGKDAIFSYQLKNGQSFKEVHAIFDHVEALNLILRSLTDPHNEILNDISEIAAVGHRVVHGGEKFTESVIVDESVMAEIRECIELAPLHNPANLQGINVSKKVMQNVPQVAVFDTAFHHSMPESAYIYGLPYVFYTRYKIRRYGFHGTSHRYVSERAVELLGKPLKSVKLITCHLGNGSSITAIKNGKSVDTSMGFTPLEGLLMGTRSGDIDPAILLYIMTKDDLSVYETNSMLNKHSGLLGISGITNDVRELYEKMQDKDTRATLALNIMTYRLKKYICSYMGTVEGADAIVFTAGIGENSSYIREKALEGLEFMGIQLDKKKNKAVSGETEISTKNSKVKIYVIPTNEELVIARDTALIVKKERKAKKIK